MTPEGILEELKMSGAHVEAVGDKLRCRAPVGVLTPELRQAMAEHKPALLRLLSSPAADAPSELPCPVCGASEWRDTPDGGRWCMPCVVAGRDPVAAVKVHSDVLDAEIWVVCDDLPREAWPTDAPVYTQKEVKILTQVGPDALAWVHATKTMFGATVIRAGRRPPRVPPAPDHEPPVEE